MQQAKDKPYIEQINQRFEREKLLINSGLIFQTLTKQIKPVSTVMLAMHLNLTVFMVRQSLKELEADGLVERDFAGDWEVRF